MGDKGPKRPMTSTMSVVWSWKTWSLEPLTIIFPDTRCHFQIFRCDCISRIGLWKSVDKYDWDIVLFVTNVRCYHIYCFFSTGCPPKLRIHKLSISLSHPCFCKEKNMYMESWIFITLAKFYEVIVELELEECEIFLFFHNSFKLFFFGGEGCIRYKWLIWK